MSTEVKSMVENAPEADQKLTHCLNLLKSGKPIFPVNQNKTPLITTWKPYQDRLPTEQEVTQWWTQWPDANIGMATGRLSGVVLLTAMAQRPLRGFSRHTRKQRRHR